MRLFSMYYMCKEYTPLVRDMNLDSRSANGNIVKVMADWQNKRKILNEIAQADPIRSAARKLYNTIPTVLQDQKQFDMAGSAADKFIIAKNELLVAMETIMKLYETINTDITPMVETGFDVKLPKFEDIGEFSSCLGDLDFIVKQCPYLNHKDAQIKYGSVDVGSTWLTFLIAGTAAITLLGNLSKLVDMAVKIKSHATTVKIQEEALRSMELKNELAGEMIDVFRQTNKVIVNQYVDDLESELGALKDGEEKDKVGRSIEKLGYWMDKGLQIYSTIDAPTEIKDLFPVQEDLSFLTEDLQKLIEMKKG